MQGRAGLALLGPVLGVALVAGCGDGSALSSSPSASSSPVPGLSPRPTPTETPAPEGALVEVEQSGGLAGLSRSVVVAPDGTVTRTVRGTAVPAPALTTEELATLRAAIAQADLPSLQPAYGEPDVADGVTTRVSASGRTVTLYTGGTRPLPLQQLVSTVEQLTS